MAWWDFYKLWTFTFEKGPLEKQKQRLRGMSGAGIGIPEGIPDLRGEAWGGGSQGQVRLHASNEFVDLQSVVNRVSRYREYERLRNVAEIEMAMTVIADESCVAGHTNVATLFDGFRPINWLKKRWEKDKKPFLVYCYDFDKEDYSFGWAYDVRLVKQAKTIRVGLDDGTSLIVTPDHRALLADGSWKHAGDLKDGDELMAFYRLPPNKIFNDLSVGQFPRIYTHKDGWKHERQMINDWKLGYTEKYYQELNKISRLIADGLPTRQVTQIVNRNYRTIDSRIRKEGFTVNELKWLGKRRKVRKVLTVMSYELRNVYDLSVKGHENFCTDAVVLHNCQRGDNNHVLKIHCNNSEVVDELEFVLFNRKMINIDRRAWNMIKRLCIFGDGFYELITNPEKPSDGVLKIQDLPPDSVYRIETTKCRLVEFQQSKEGPDWHALTRSEITKSTEADLQQSTAIRFSPYQLVHFRLGDDRRTFYPYGQSLIEPARGPAHQLRLMEDAMLVYRLTRAPERRVFYIDVGQLPPFKAEAFIERLKDQFRKKKVATTRGGGTGANAVEERWHAPAQDEDYWLPIRPNANTRIETLPGACLTLDTKIPLLDGNTNSLNEIIEKFENGEILWAYSCNPATGEIVPGNITWAGVTRKNSEIVRITLDNGKYVEVTPDHKFPILERGYVETKDLKVGDRLIPFNRRREKIKPSHKNTYEQIYDVSCKQWKFTHRLVADFFEENKNQNVIHHVDFNRYNKKLYNHRIVSIEILKKKKDVGTITIDGQNKLHGFHTFALDCGVFTKNSNLGEIDDALYFRNKLFSALNFPRNYFNNEDPGQTRITLSAQDIKFARMIERIQGHFVDGIMEIAERHLEMRGFPEEEYEDLKIEMTPPSAWKELSEAEVINQRIQWITGLN